MFLAPATGATMQFGYQGGLCLLQAATQHLGKELMVAIPAPLIVERDDKQVRLLEPLQHGLAPLLLSYSVAERPAEARENRGGEQKRLHLCGLPREHLL